jgi:hypothetical protein
MAESSNYPFIDVFNNVVKGILEFAEFLNQLETYLKQPEVAEKLRAFLDNIKNFPIYDRSVGAKMAEFGWYTNWETPIDANAYLAEAVKGDISKLDDFMESHLVESWLTLTTRILKNYPQRTEILSTAFTLHTEGRFVASIPLFLSQCDGIVFAKFNHSLFGKRNKKLLIGETLKEKIERGEIEKDGVLDIFYEALRVKNAFSANSSDANTQSAPNRHGVLHGLEGHLDYGTKKNSLKTFSLLAYLDSMFNEE